ncbi:MAG: hypothetical protein ACLQFI_09810, partial [Methylocella sp.]
MPTDSVGAFPGWDPCSARIHSPSGYHCSEPSWTHTVTAEAIGLIVAYTPQGCTNYFKTGGD